MKNLTDDELNYIQKHLKNQSPEKIADHLKMPLADFYTARLGLTGEKPPNFLVVYRKLINTFYSHILVVFTLFLLFSHLMIHDGKGPLQIKLVLPIALIFLAFFFLKFTLFHITSIEQSPLDLLFIFIQCLLFLLSQIFKSEIIFSALTLIFLLAFIVYYLTLNAILEKDLQLLFKFIPFATLLLSILPNYFIGQLSISGQLIMLLSLISLPLLICFFIYAQKSSLVFLYGLMIGALLGMVHLNFNSILNKLNMTIMILLYLGLICYLKFSLKSKIVVSKLFYIALFFIPIGFFTFSHLFSPTIFLDYKNLPISSSNFQLFLSLQTSFPKFFPPFLLVFSLLIYWKFFKSSIEIIKDADCFSEKLFAATALPMALAVFLTIADIKLWEEVCFYLIFMAILSGTIAKQYFFKIKEKGNATIKIKKITEIKGVPAFILSFFLFLGSLWFYFFAK